MKIALERKKKMKPESRSKARDELSDSDFIEDPESPLFLVIRTENERIRLSLLDSLELSKKLPDLIPKIKVELERIMK